MAVQLGVAAQAAEFEVVLVLHALVNAVGRFIDLVHVDLEAWPVHYRH
ncbi:MAG TPA: hypothetical protein VJT49_00940 [Amycolatopsis sp.]|nr:hypothetical protein [Amycolatopsis sp.]HKS43681.1 hypothetical protein [Amycolatopsis sp.]